MGNGMKYYQNFNSLPTFSTIPDSNVTLPTVFDVGRVPEIKMEAVKPEVVVSWER